MTKAIYQRDYTVEPPYINKATRRNWVSFDYDNLYPQHCLLMAQESPLQSAILSNKVKYMYGAGVKDYTASIFTPNLADSWEDLIQKCMTDYAYLEAFAIQAILNEDGTKFTFFHQPVSEVRFGNYNEHNQIDTAYLSTDWRTASSRNVVEIKMFGSETPKKGTPYLMYFKKYQPNEYYYAVPKWMSSANWILADIALSKYYLNYIKNNFSANLVIQYPTEPEDDKKMEIYEMLQSSFGGEDNAGQILLLFGENGVSPSISNIESTNADLYNSVCDTVLKYVVSGNRLTSPMLAGLATSSGFSSKSDEIIAAYTQYKLTVVDEARAFVMDKINYLLQLNGYPRCLEIQDYNLTKEFEGADALNDKKESEQTNADADATNNEELNDIENGKE